MLEVVVRAALGTLLLALVIQLCLWALRVRHSNLLLSAWTAVLAASLTMPVLPRVLPTALPSPPLSFSLPMVVDPVVPTRHAAPIGTGSPAAIVTRAAEPHPAFDWRDWLTRVYVFGAVALLLRILLGLILSRRMLRTASPLRGAWAAGRKVRVSDAISTPVTIAGTILLPTGHTQWDASTLQAVLAHEAAHVARGDFYVQLLSQTNRAVFWFSPLSWWLHARLGTLAELASDDAAIEALGDRPGYASILLDVARLAGTHPAGVAM